MIENQEKLKKVYIEKIKQMCDRGGKWLREKMFYKFTVDELRDLIRHIEDAQLVAIDEYKKLERVN